jgi:hypothetical protein
MAFNLIKMDSSGGGAVWGRVRVCGKDRYVVVPNVAKRPEICFNPDELS